MQNPERTCLSLDGHARERCEAHSRDRGGTGPESTVDYYRSVFAAWRRHRSDGTFPRVIINSIEGGGLWHRLEANDHEAVLAEIGDAVDRLSAAGAGLAILASNTLHSVFDEVARRASVPMLSIITETVEAVIRMRLRQPALLRSRFVMESDLYLEPLRRAGISAVVPNQEERSFLHDRYGEELIIGKFSGPRGPK